MELMQGTVRKLDVGVDKVVRLQVLSLELDMKPSNMPSEIRLFAVVSDSANTRAIRFHERLLPLVKDGILTQLATFDAHLKKALSHRHEVPLIAIVANLQPNEQVIGNPTVEDSVAYMLRVVRDLSNLPELDITFQRGLSADFLYQIVSSKGLAMRGPVVQTITTVKQDKEGKLTVTLSDGVATYLAEDRTTTSLRKFAVIVVDSYSIGNYPMRKSPCLLRIRVLAHATGIIGKPVPGVTAGDKSGAGGSRRTLLRAGPTGCCPTCGR